MAYATFNLNVDYGMKRVTTFRTLILDLGDGHEQRVSKSSVARHKFSLTFNNRLTSEMKAGLYDFYIARKGNFEAFQIVDPLTSTVRVVRFEEGELSEEMFSRLLENSEIAVIEVQG